MKNLFQVDPNVEGKDIYIIGTDADSLLLFSVMLQNKIYIKGFIHDGNKSYDGSLRIMNKPIVEIDDVEKNAVIIASDEKQIDFAKKCENRGYDVYFDFNFTAYKGDSILLDGEVR